MDSKLFYRIFKVFSKMPWISFFFLFKTDHIYFAFNVLWLQYISRWVWFENNKHWFHKLMSSVINLYSQTLLNSELLLGIVMALDHFSVLAWRQEDGKQEKSSWGHRWEVRRVWEDFSVQNSEQQSSVYNTHFPSPCGSSYGEGLLD